MSPREPAVIPILTKKPNSSKSLAPVGIEINALVKNVLTNIEVKISGYGR